jgi:spore coat protein CotH
MMRDFGNPAPDCNHLKVYVNDALYGTMENIEEPETGRFVAHHFGEAAVASAEVYQGSPSQGSCSGADKYQDSAAKLVYLGDTFSSYPQMYKITRGSTAKAEAHLIPMLKCGDGTATASDDTFKTCISEWLDVNEWLRQIAAESLMPTLESSMVMRNFLLYFVPDAAAPHGGRFQVGSWDLDVAFQKASCYPSSCDPMTSTAGYYGPGGTRPKLYSRLTKVFKTEYCAAMKKFLTDVYKPAAADQMATVAGVDGSAIKTFITSHGSSAMTQVTTACQ